MRMISLPGLRDESGATGLEYALIAGILVVVLATGAALAGDSLTALASGIADKVAQVAN